MGDILETSKVRLLIGFVLAIAAVAGVAYFNQTNKENAAKLYPNQLISYLSQQKTSENNLQEEFNIINYMDPNKRYVMINKKKTNTILNDKIIGTYLLSTGNTIQNGATVGMPALDPKDGQVVVGLFTNDIDTVNGCIGTGSAGGTTILDVNGFEQNSNQDTPDLCRGYDSSVSKVLFVGKPDVIKALRKDAFNNSASTIVVNVDNGTNVYSGILVPVNR